MKYGLVRQFYNQSVDNFFKFFYKIGDFFKMLVELFWAFYDVWEAFFLIFFNLFMYVYYLLLFIIDKSSESQARVYYNIKIPKRVPFRPGRVYDRYAVNPVPAMYGREKAVPAAVSAAVSTSADKLNMAASGARGSLLKAVVEFTGTVVSLIKKAVLFPFRALGGLLLRRARPVKEESIPRGRGLIDEYIKEYEGRKKA